MTSKLQMLNKAKNIYEKSSEAGLVWGFSLLSLFLSIRVIYIQHGWINDDSVLYFEAAKLFAIGHWQAGFALYNWPFYSALIAFTHNLTSLDIQTSAQVLNVVFFAITTFSFLTLIRMAGGKKVTISCGAFLLFGSDYIVGSVLSMLLRDQGFWAFFLTSLIFFVRFYRSGHLVDCLIWQICIIIAMLFRIEAITYLVLLPLVLIKNDALTRLERIKWFAQSNVVVLLGSALLGITYFIAPSFQLEKLGRIQEALILNNDQVVQDLMKKADLMGHLVLGSNFSEYALVGLIITLLWILIIKSAQAAGWICIGLISVANKSSLSKPYQDAKIILYWVLCISLLNLAIIILRTYVVSGRYVIPIGFIIMIFASFCFASLFEVSVEKNRLPKDKKKWLLAVALVLLSLNLIKNIAPKAKGHNYQQEAVAWVKANVSPGSTVFYDSPRLRYYAGEALTERGMKPWEVVKRSIKDQSINKYDYLVVHISRRAPDQQTYLTKTLNRPILKEFRSENGDRILIFSKTSINSEATN